MHGPWSSRGSTATGSRRSRQHIQEEDPPEGLPATEIVALHDAGQGKALVVIFFDSDDDYARGDEVLNAMPGEDTPGRRTGVEPSTRSWRAGRSSLYS